MKTIHIFILSIIIATLAGCGDKSGETSSVLGTVVLPVTSTNTTTTATTDAITFFPSSYSFSASSAAGSTGQIYVIGGNGTFTATSLTPSLVSCSISGRILTVTKVGPSSSSNISIEVIDTANHRSSVLVGIP